MPQVSSNCPCQTRNLIAQNRADIQKLNSKLNDIEGKICAINVAVLTPSHGNNSNDNPYDQPNVTSQQIVNNEDLSVLQSHISLNNEVADTVHDTQIHSTSTESDFIFEDAVQDIPSDIDRTPSLNLN